MHYDAARRTLYIFGELTRYKQGNRATADALIAFGAVIRGETYHFELVANESASGITRVALDYNIPVANGILTTEDDEQCEDRIEGKAKACAQVAVEMANLATEFPAYGEEDDETEEAEDEEEKAGE